MSLAQILGPDTSSQTVDVVIGFLHHLARVAERNCGNDWSEDFFLHDLHLFSSVYQHRGIHEVALVPVALPANRGLGSFCKSRLKVTTDAFELLLGNQRTHVAGFLPARAYFDLLSFFADAFHHLVEYFVLDV